MQNYPLINPKIRLLAGEEIKRRFEWRIVCTNPDNFTLKEQAQKEAIMAYVEQELSSDNQDPEKIKSNLSQIQKYYKYDYQDMREKLSSDILKFYYQEQECQRKFNEGFMHALIGSDEIYRLDIVAGEPKITTCDPLRVYVYGNGLSPYIDEADIIVEDTYQSIGSVIDEFYEDLKESDIKKLEDTINSISSGTNRPGEVNYDFRIPSIRTTAFSDDLIAWDSKTHSSTDDYYDSQGNVRVIRVRWKSKRKIGKLKFYNEDNVPEYKIVDENYEHDETYGEEIKWFWINEYWEGVRLAKDIYIKIRPLPSQYKSINNISKSFSGYIGTTYNVGSLKGRSLFDQLKPFQYLYNIFMYRTELAFASYKGSRIVFPSTLIPNDWDMEKWLHYSEVLGYLIVNPYNEIQTGSFQGDIAGSLNQFQPQILSDDSVANFIQSNIQMLSYIEKQVGSISGVSEQRQGQVETRELVGNVERSITQSSHVTELWFSIHENTKTRVLTAFLELAKYCIKKKTDKRFYHILDEVSIKTLETEPEYISDADLAIFVTSSSKYIEFEQAIKQLAHAAMQNQMIGFKEIIDIYQANSIVDMSKIMENAEEMKRQQAMQQEKAQRDHEKQIQEAQLAAQKEMQAYEHEKREDEQMHEIAKIKIEAEENRKTEILKISLANNPEVKASEVAMKAAEIEAKMSLAKEKQDNEYELKKQKQEQELELAKRKVNNEIKLSEKQIKDEQKDSKEYLKLDSKAVEQDIKLAEKQFKHDVKMAQEELKLKEKEIQEKIKAQKEKVKADIALQQQKAKEDAAIRKAKGNIDLNYKEKENELKLEAKEKELKQKPKTNKN